VIGLPDEQAGSARPEIRAPGDRVSADATCRMAGALAMMDASRGRHMRWLCPRNRAAEEAGA